MLRFKSFFYILFFIFFNASYSQEKMKFPLKEIMEVGDGYLIGVNLLEDTVEFFLCDSERNRISVKKLHAAIIFIYDDKSEDFRTDLKKGKNNIFIDHISKEKTINSMGFMIKLNDKQYNAAFLYPEAMKKTQK